jgi:hypothetical protein
LNSVIPQGPNGSDGRSVDRVWKDALSELALQLTKESFRLWFQDAALLAAGGDCWTIGVRSDEAVDWLENRYRRMMERTVSAVAGRPVSLALVTKGAWDGKPATASPAAKGQAQPVEQTQPVAPVHVPSNGSPAAQLLSAVPPAASRVGEAGREPGEVVVKKERKDPAGPYLMVPHYTFRFWQPLLGVRAYALFVTLNHCADAHKYFGEPLPSIEALVEMIGYGSRHTLLGRGPTKGRPPQTGILDLLVETGLARLWRTGRGQGTRYVFAVYPVEDLPLLTPFQVGKLSDRKQREHETWLRHFKLFDESEWHRDQRETAVPADWWGHLQ